MSGNQTKGASMQQRPIITAGGVSFIVGALAFVSVFSYLAANFDYPSVLDGSAAEVLPRLRAGGSILRAAWALYAFLPLILLPGAVGTFVACPSSRGRLREDGAQGTREYIRVLRLLKKHSVKRVTRAIENALTLRRCTRDVVFQFLYPDPLPAVPTFTLDGREHLQGIRVDLPNLRGYAALLGGPN